MKTFANILSQEPGKSTPEIEPVPPQKPEIPKPEIVPEPDKNKPEKTPSPEIKPFTEPGITPGKEL